MSVNDTPNHPVSSAPAAVQLKALLLRLHFYIGLLVGPFILFAAFSGTLYALSPALEQWLYRDALTTPSQGPAQSLEKQIDAASHVVGDNARLSAIRPAPHAGMTTRVMYTSPDLRPSESRAIFVDPINLAIRGDLSVYGTSGVLPLRTWIDQLHRSLLLGNLGRHYSELAASWLWVAALGGLALWWLGRSRAPSRQIAPAMTPGARRARLRHRHSTLGLCLLIGLLFFSATGLTWSQWAGSNIGVLRAAWGWGTPSASTALNATPEASGGAHAQHGASMASDEAFIRFPADTADRVLALARRAGIDAGLVEIQPATTPGKAWKVREIDRSWPTNVDEVTIDARHMTLVDQVTFAHYPLAAKLTRWGIDAHMGVLFGLPNQLILAAFALGICVMVVWGYAMWWRRRPRAVAPRRGQPSLLAMTGQLPLPYTLVLLAVAFALGLALPVMGVSLAALLVIDGLHGWFAQRRLVAGVQYRQ